MSKTTIKPCPFCGTRAVCVKNSTGYIVGCPVDTCLACIDFGGAKEETIAAWNRRTWAEE